MPQVDTPYQEQIKCYHKAVAELGDYFKQVNPNFDASRFSKAIYEL